MIADNALSKIYYSPQGYWRDKAAIKKLANPTKVSEYIAEIWLKRQNIYFNSASIL